MPERAIRKVARGQSNRAGQLKAGFDRAEAGYMTELAGSASTVHVACCFDQKMELPFLVLASSLKRHLKGDRKVVLHAFHSDPIAHDPAYFAELNSVTFELRL